MDWLFDNPIGNMRGPQFLAVFAVVAAGCILWAYRRTRAADGTAQRDVPELPVEFDPFEIAYLRGGAHELARLMIFDLLTRGYLDSFEERGWLGTKTRKIRAAPAHLAMEYLEAGERAVFQWMRGGKDASAIFPALSKHLEAHGYAAQYRTDLENRELLTSAARRTAIWQAMLPALFVVIVLAGYKLLAALAHGRHNIFFLIALTVIASVALIFTSQPKRLTALGRKYFARIQEALSMLKGRTAALVAGKSNDHLVLAVSAFGISALEGTAYGYYPEMFKKAAQQNSGGGCGGGCGSSCGSSCGGGCGGGGCGGCGG